MTDEQTKLSQYIAEMLGECWHDWEPRGMYGFNHGWTCKSCGKRLEWNARPPSGTPYATDLNAAMRALTEFLRHSATANAAALHVRAFDDGEKPSELFMLEIYHGDPRGIDSDTFGERDNAAAAICEAIRQFKQAQESTDVKEQPDDR